MEYERLRGLRESEEELAKVQQHIDKMIEKNIKRMQEEKRKREPKVVKKDEYPTLMELVREKSQISLNWTNIVFFR